MSSAPFHSKKGIQKSKRVVDTPLDHLSIGEFSLNYNEITILKSRFATPALKLERCVFCYRGRVLSLAKTLTPRIALS